MNRRRFIRESAGAGLVLGRMPALGLLRRWPPSRLPPSSPASRPAITGSSRTARSSASSARGCAGSGDKERGYCGVRENQGGTYYTLVYGKACSLNVDPVEKKPFFHVLPGTNALSLATAGCNVNCKFCQNWQISQVRPEQVEHFDLPPDGRRRDGRTVRLSVRRLYLHRARRVLRVHGRRGRRRPAQRDPEPRRHRGARQAGAPAGPPRARGRGQDRPQVLLQGFLCRVRPGGSRGGPRGHPDRGREQGLARGGLSRHPDPQRLPRRDPGNEPVAEGGSRAGRSPALLPLPADVPGQEPSADAGLDPGEVPRGSPSKRACATSTSATSRATRPRARAVRRAAGWSSRGRDTPSERTTSGAGNAVSAAPRSPGSGPDGRRSRPILLGFTATAFQIYLLGSSPSIFPGTSWSMASSWPPGFSGEGVGSLVGPRLAGSRGADRKALLCRHPPFSGRPRRPEVLPVRSRDPSRRSDRDGAGPCRRRRRRALRRAFPWERSSP